MVGAGVAGLCLGLELQRSGANCTLLDPAPLGANASGVAAGMLAPAFESLSYPAATGAFHLFREGRDLWSGILGEESGLERSGTLWIALRGQADDAPALAAALRNQGARAELLSAAETLRLSPELSNEVEAGVFTPDDWRLEPLPALRRLSSKFVEAGGVLRPTAARRISGRAVQDAGEALSADAVAVCAGWGAASFGDAVPELACLQPIKGELARFPGAPPHHGPVVRFNDGYLAPSEAGVVVGATMEAGVADPSLTEAQTALTQAATRLLPHLAAVGAEGAAAIRAATPDGLPLVGRSRGGVWLVAGFRRNGWSLAPVAARMIAAGLAGSDPGSWAEPLRPDRFLIA